MRNVVDIFTTALEGLLNFLPLFIPFQITQKGRSTSTHLFVSVCFLVLPTYHREISADDFHWANESPYPTSSSPTPTSIETNLDTKQVNSLTPHPFL